MIWEATMAQLAGLRAVSTARRLEELMEKYPVLKQYLRIQYLYDIREGADDEFDLDTSKPVDARIEGKVPFNIVKQLPLSETEAKVLKPYVDFGNLVPSGHYPANKWQVEDKKDDILLVKWADYDDITPHYGLYRIVDGGAFGRLYERLAEVYGEPDESFIKRCQELGLGEYFERREKMRRLDAKVDEVLDAVRPLKPNVVVFVDYDRKNIARAVVRAIVQCKGNGKDYLPRDVFNKVVATLKGLGFRFDGQKKEWVKEVVAE